MSDVSPELFVSGVWAFQTTGALKAAIELDLFTAIGEGERSCEALARRTSASERGVRTLADLLVVRGFLEKPDGFYTLTASSAAFLDRRSPTYMGSIVDYLASPEMLDLALADPAATVRRGGSLGLANLANDNPIWVKFARAMRPFLMPVAAQVAAQVAAWSTPPQRVLDVAAGHGMFGIMLAQAVTGAEITAIDWAIVLEEARENASRMGVGDRYHTIAGNAFDVDWGGGFDLVLLPNFLHHFDPETCTALLCKVHASLSPQGRVLACEFVPNPDRVSPPLPAAFSYEMLISTPSGDAYTEAEFNVMARASGFSGVSAVALPPTPQTLVEFLR